MHKTGVGWQFLDQRTTRQRDATIYLYLAGFQQMIFDAILIDQKDNVATALKDLAAGSTVSIGAGSQTVALVLGESITAGHKLAVRNIPRGGAVLKYGEIIGLATCEITAGSGVHVHNVEGRRGRGDLP